MIQEFSFTEREGTKDTMDFSRRHASTQQIMQYFAYAHLPAPLQVISKPCCEVAEHMCSVLTDSPELTAGLRKLLEAKDCFVRAAL